MRVLAVSYMLPPMLYPQAIQVGRLLAYMAADIAAVSGRPAAATGALDCYADLDRELAFHLSVPYRRTLSGPAFRVAMRFLPLYGRVPDEYRTWVPRAESALAAKLDESDFRPDVFITFGEPMSDHLLGLRLKRRLGLPWVAHFSDPWCDNPFRRHNLLANMFNRRQERHVIESADRVIFTSRETINLVMAKYPAAWRNKVRLLQHSFDPALYPDTALRQDGSRDGIVVSHLGNFYGKRTPYPLFRAIRLLHDHDPSLLEGVRFELFGGMPSAFRWHPSYRALPPGIVHIRGTVNYRESLRAMKVADMLLVMDAPDDLSVFLPSKLIDYLGSGTPIMGIVPPGTSASLLTRLGGVTADPRAPEEVATALARAIASARGRARSNIMEAWGDPVIRAEFDPRYNAAALEDILRDCVAGAAACSA